MHYCNVDLNDNVAQVIRLRPTPLLNASARSTSSRTSSHDKPTPLTSLAGGGRPAGAAGIGAGGHTRKGGEGLREGAIGGGEGEIGRGEGAPQLPDIVVGNIHVLFNPRRGDVKLGQVRTHHCFKIPTGR